MMHMSDSDVVIELDVQSLAELSAASLGDGFQDHHLIPTSQSDHPVLRALGSRFNIQERSTNIIGLPNKATSAQAAGMALAFDRKIMGDAHLWREHRFISMEPFLSDTLQSEIAKAGLRLPKRWKAREV